jgi:hypothetical protein
MFDGIGGPKLQVLYRTNERGWDISNSFANEVMDFDGGQVGTLMRRPGSRKIATSGKTASVTTIFQVRIGALVGYGVISNGTLDIIDLPQTSGIVS